MTITTSRLYRDYPLYIYFISLATVLDFATIDNVNFLFIGLSILSLSILIFFNSKAIPKPENGFLILFFLFMAAVSLWNYDTVRWTGLVYSCFFIITFVFYVPFFKQYLDISRFRRLLKIVFYLYFVGLIAGQLNYYFDFFAGLHSFMGPMLGSFGIVIEKDGLRFFSLSSEPSYAAFIAIVIFYSYLKLDSDNNALYKKENIVMFFLLLYMIFMFKSAYGVMLLGLLVLDYVGFSSTIVVMGVVVIGISAILMVNEVDIKALNRVVNLIQKIDLSDPHGLYAIDFTAYYRVAPMLHYVTSADFTDFNFLFGHGPGASRLYVVPEIYGGYIGGEFLGGFLPAFLFDYGFIGGILIFWFLLRQVPSFFSFPTAVIGLMLLNANLNTQLFWLIALCFALLKFYLKSSPAPIYQFATEQKSIV